MKRVLSLALGCLLLCAAMTAASANQWGLRGGVYDIVADDDRYEGYTAIADDGNTQLTDGPHANQAILENRYHAVLINALRYDKVWQAADIVTTAVYQPGDARGEFPNNPILTHLEDGFLLSYGDAECYIFLWNGEDYGLSEVRYGETVERYNSFILDGGRLLFWQSGSGESFQPIGDGLWDTTITLEEFNITQMPRSLAEVRQLTMTSIFLTESVPRLEMTGRRAASEDADMLAVYSAPDTASYRAAGGKAGVSLGGDIDIYGTAEGWTLIGYEVSPRTSRIGYVQTELGEEALRFTSLPLRAVADTFLTDDPFVSQYAQAEIPAGAPLTGLAQCGEYYAYVSYQAGETLYRGFVPMKDLMPVYDRALVNGDELLTADVRWDVMDTLCGKWYPVDGSWQDMTVLYTDGTFLTRISGMTRDVGNYRIYDRAEGGYTLYLVTEANEETTCALTLNEDGTITLTDDRGETVYRREEYSTYGNG